MKRKNVLPAGRSKTLSASRERPIQSAMRAYVKTQLGDQPKISQKTPVFDTRRLASPEFQYLDKVHKPRHLAPWCKIMDKNILKADKADCHAVPWFLLFKEHKRGRSIKSLSIAYRVSEERIREKMLTWETVDGGVRTALDIKQASKRVHCDLVQALEFMARSIATKANFTNDDITKLAVLTNTAARLFAWPAAASRPGVDMSSIDNPSPLSNAINLALINTTPDQLRKLADNQPIMANSDNTRDLSGELGSSANRPPHSVAHLPIADSAKP